MAENDQIQTSDVRSFTDCRTAMTAALMRFLLTLRFDLPRTNQPFGFKKALGDWATFSDRSLSPASLPVAAVLPDNPIYDADSFTPRADERSWTGGDPTELRRDGTKRFPNGDGTGVGKLLFTISEMVVPFVVLVRARSKPERRAIVHRMEQVFLEDGTQPDGTYINPRTALEELESQPTRYGRILTLPLYFNRKARFTLMSQQLLDSETTSMENRWMAQFEIQGHAKTGVVRCARAMSPRVSLILDGTEVARSGPDE